MAALIISLNTIIGVRNVSFSPTHSLSCPYILLFSWHRKPPRWFPIKMGEFAVLVKKTPMVPHETYHLTAKFEACNNTAASVTDHNTTVGQKPERRKWPRWPRHYHEVRRYQTQSPPLYILFPWQMHSCNLNRYRYRAEGDVHDVGYCRLRHFSDNYQKRDQILFRSQRFKFTRRPFENVGLALPFTDELGNIGLLRFIVSCKYIDTSSINRKRQHRLPPSHRQRLARLTSLPATARYMSSGWPSYWYLSCSRRENGHILILWMIIFPMGSDRYRFPLSTVSSRKQCWNMKETITNHWLQRTLRPSWL